MSVPPDPLASFATMLGHALGESLAREAGSFLEMFAEDGVMEFPYAPPGGVTRVQGRAALADYLTKVTDVVRIDRMSDAAVHRTLNPEVFILEFSAEGGGMRTGLPYDQRYISVITVRAGHIVHYRDDWNPLVALRAMGDRQALADALSLREKGGADAAR